MGHVENKCEVRFSMEQDDGVRGWSAEIRADNRKQGGRFTSWWLKEDGGGSSEMLGEERVSRKHHLEIQTWVPHTITMLPPHPMKHTHVKIPITKLLPHNMKIHWPLMDCLHSPLRYQRMAATIIITLFPNQFPYQFHTHQPSQPIK
jgi:hypothetical protein